MKKGSRFGCIVTLVLNLSVWAALAWLLCACSPTKYVPVESVHTEYRDRDNTQLMETLQMLMERLRQKERQVDSLMMMRNERIVLNDKGDTLRHDREAIVYRSSHREQELERLVAAKNDSIRLLMNRLASVKTDSIPVPYPVERELSRWERTKIDYGGFAIAGMGAVICFAVVCLARKFRK